MGGQRKALIVANDEYDHEALRRLMSPSADARALARVLGDRDIGGFHVDAVLNEPAHDVEAQIEDLFADSQPEDLLLLHFSCHGLKSEAGELFFAARNTRPARLGSTAIADAWLPAASSSLQTCAPVQGDKLVVLKDDKGLQNADNIVPVVKTCTTVPELAEALRVHRSTVYQKARSGEWPGIKVGGDWRFDVWAIREMLKQKWSMRL